MLKYVDMILVVRLRYGILGIEKMYIMIRNVESIWIVFMNVWDMRSLENIKRWYK